MMSFCIKLNNLFFPQGPEVLAGPDHEVDPEVHPVAEPELLPVTMCRCQKCRSTFLKVVYLI